MAQKQLSPEEISNTARQFMQNHGVSPEMAKEMFCAAFNFR